MITELLNNINDNGIAYAIVCALSAWLGKCWAARIGRSDAAKLQEQITRLKDELERAQRVLSGNVERFVHVHKVQFEKEFLVYQDLMKHANRLRRAFFTLHQNLQPIFDKKEEAEAHFKPLRKDFAEAFTVTRDIIEENRPFYADKVFLQCDRLIELAVTELSSLSLSEGLGILTFKEIDRMKKELTQVHKDLADSIRQRLDTIVIIE